MRVLIAQPKHEDSIEILESILLTNPAIDLALFPEGYITNSNSLVKASQLAKNQKTIIVTSYRKDGADIAVIIDKKGIVAYERKKTNAAISSKLVQPLISNIDGVRIGFLLCMEILKGRRDMNLSDAPELIVHPIGVGMFSDDQYKLWLDEACLIAKKQQAIVIGTSHADGSYKNCGVSIPIAYYIDQRGTIMFNAKADTRTRVIDTVRKTIDIIKD